MDFGLEKYQAEPTAVFEIETPDNPKITLKQATRLNKKFFAIYLKKTAKIKNRGGKLSDRQLQQMRDILLELVPRFVATGWENVFDGDGNLVEFSPENCEAYLRQLEAYLPDQLDLLLAFCQTPSNYRDELDEDELGND